MNEGPFFRIFIRKEALKFAAAHMTVFADGSKERLHGHNYTTELIFDFPDASLSKMIPFSEVKKVLRSLCEEWDEKVLLPTRCPYFKAISENAESFEFLLCNKRYVLPLEGVELLAVDNITVETLAQELSRRLLVQLRDTFIRHQVIRLELRVDEMPGQGASFVCNPSASQKILEA